MNFHYKINKKNIFEVQKYKNSFYLMINILLFICSSLSVVIFSVLNSSFSIFASYFIFYIIGFLISIFFDSFATRIFNIIYNVATIFCIFFYFLFQFQYGIPYGSGGSDSLLYEQYASIIANSILYYDANEIGIAINIKGSNTRKP